MSSEKTEQPTPKKLREARQKGQVAHSKDASSTALLVAVFVYFFVGWPWISDELQEAILLPAKVIDKPLDEGLKVVFLGLATIAIHLSLPLLAIVIVVGIGASFLQTGPLLVFEPVKPDFKKLNPFDRLKQIFSIKNLIEFLKSVIKVTALIIIVAMVIRDSLPALIHSTQGDLPGILFCLKASMYRLATWTGTTYLVVAVFDFWFQRRQHVKGLRMSKDEVKREYKESEGDPHIKGKRKQLHQEMVMSDAAPRIRKSTVLVTNPTHKAVAIYYRQEETPLPRIEAKGEEHLALQMIQIAKEAGVPIVQNVPLAWALYDGANVDEYIPAELIEPVAEVLRWLAEISKDQNNN